MNQNKNLLLGFSLDLPPIRVRSLVPSIVGGPTGFGHPLGKIGFSLPLPVPLPGILHLICHFLMKVNLENMGLESNEALMFVHKLCPKEGFDCLIN